MKIPIYLLDNTYEELLDCRVSVQRKRWHPTPVLLPGKSHGRRSLVGCSPWGHEESDTTEWLHFHFHALEKEMATHSGVLAWRIPGTGEPGGLPSVGLHRVGHDWSDLAAAAAAMTNDVKYFFMYVLHTWHYYAIITCHYYMFFYEMPI